MRLLKNLFLPTVVVLVVPSWFNSTAIAAAGRPNIVFIIADDVDVDDLGCYGHPTIKTPHLDALAAEGLAFDRAYLTTSSCSPTRCSIITGRYPHNTGAPELHVPLPAGQFMFPQALREGGYYTVLAGKNHMGPAVRTAFDKITEGSDPGRERDWVRNLRERPKGKPFFMWFASTDAHRDWQFDKKTPRYDPADVVVPPYLVDGPKTRQDLANYYHEISRLDRFVGRVRRELERQGVAKNTYVIFCVDNGRPFPRCKTRLYDSGTRTPLIIWRPGAIKPARTASLASVVDIAPTILELAGVTIDKRVQGVSLAPIFANPRANVRDYAFAEHNWHVMPAYERSVRRGDWLYIRNGMPERLNQCVESGPEYPAGDELWTAYDKGQLTAVQLDVFLQPRPAEELYNVAHDPHQLHNLAELPDHAATIKELSSVLDRWTAETGDSEPAKPTPGTMLTGVGQGMQPDFTRGDLPGADRGATTITAPGPIRIKL